MFVPTELVLHDVLVQHGQRVGLVEVVQAQVRMLDAYSVQNGFGPWRLSGFYRISL